jgi:AICAR transformylase/IMP cyclohydrolase PurH
VQEPDVRSESVEDLQQVTAAAASAAACADAVFAQRIAKHTRSNTIVFARDLQLLGSGTGQTSRVDALRQAVAKAHAFGFTLDGAVMASDAFFPFADCVELAYEAGVRTVVQPGGSVRDSDSIAYCDAHGMAMSHEHTCNVLTTSCDLHRFAVCDTVRLDDVVFHHAGYFFAFILTRIFKSIPYNTLGAWNGDEF